MPRRGDPGRIEPDDYQFEADSPVGRYWLINGAGFTVCRADGRKLGVVEGVVVDHVRLRAKHVIVRRRGLWRSTTIDPHAVEAVVPASRLLVIASAPRRAKRPSLARRMLRRLAAGLAADLAVARREAPRLERRLRSAARIAAVRLEAAARIAGRVLGELAVLAAVLAADAWRRATAPSTPRAMPPDDSDAPQSPGDADAPLARETSDEAPTPAGERRRR